MSAATGSADAPPVRLLLADDQHLVRSGLRSLLDHEPGLMVVAEAADGLEVLDAVREHHPDVVLMDLRMPRMDGITATERVRAVPSPPAVLVLTTFDADEDVFRALRAGASGFLLKDAPQEQLVAAIRAAAAGLPAVSAGVLDRMAGHLAPEPAAADRWPALHRLSPRELDVLGALATGASNARIARDLGLRETTVKSHVAHVLAKLDVASRAEAVVVAYESGLVRPGGAPG